MLQSNNLFPGFYLRTRVRPMCITGGSCFPCCRGTLPADGALNLSECSKVSPAGVCIPFFAQPLTTYSCPNPSLISLLSHIGETFPVNDFVCFFNSFTILYGSYWVLPWWPSCRWVHMEATATQSIPAGDARRADKEGGRGGREEQEGFPIKCVSVTCFHESYFNCCKLYFVVNWLVCSVCNPSEYCIACLLHLEIAVASREIIIS